MTKEEQEQTTIREQIEHQNLLVDIQNVLTTKSGKNLFRYLLNSLDVGGLPEQGLPENMMREYLGFLRAGQSIYRILAQASPDAAATLLASIEKERYANRED